MKSFTVGNPDTADAEATARFAAVPERSCRTKETGDA
jgi:hypothetical protein